MSAAFDVGIDEELDDSSVREVSRTARRTSSAPPAVSRYRVLERIASGGMAAVYLGHHVGLEGFTRAVAIKKLHPACAEDPEFVDMLLDEARIAARIRHPNVVATLDVERNGADVSLIMEYVEGAPLSQLMRSAHAVDCLPTPAIVTGILVQMLQGLHAAHEARGEDGAPLDIVHRDVSPQNVMLGVEGIVRIVDFGIAKAASRVSSTRGGQVKGKLRYLSPEQVSGLSVDRRSDLFSAAVVAWECLTGRRLFDGQSPGEIMARILADDVPNPGSYVRISSALARVVLRALSYRPEHRYASARDMARALALAEPPASTIEIGAWVEQVSGQLLRERARGIARAEQSSLVDTSDFATHIEDGIVPTPPLHQIVRSASSCPANEGQDEEVSEWTERTQRARRNRLATVAAAASAALVALICSIALLGESALQLERHGVLRAEGSQAVLAPPKSLDELPPQKTRRRSQPRRAEAQPTRGKAERTAKLCSPPYVIDASGNKRFRRECFK